MILYYHTQFRGFLCRWREMFWIIRVGKTLKSFIYKCSICQKYNSKKSDSTCVIDLDQPAAAIWWGGWRELLIRIIKQLLRKPLGFLYHTKNNECEAITNSRLLKCERNRYPRFGWKRCLHLWKHIWDISIRFGKIYISDFGNNFFLH